MSEIAGSVVDMEDPYLLTHAERMDELLSCEQQIAALQARQLHLIEALRRDPLPEPAGKEFVREEVRVHLRWSESVTYDRFTTATALAEHLTATAQALAAGEISYPQAEAMARGSVGMAAETIRQFESVALPFAQTHDLTATRRKINRELLRLLPTQETYESARQQRTVWSAPDSPGMTRLGALLPSEDAAVVMSALALLADRTDDTDSRTKPQRMADALTKLGQDLLRGGCSHCGLPTRPVQTAVQVTVALSTLLGLDEQAGELNGEPIPPALAVALAHGPHSTWRRLVTDKMGQLIDYGRRTYRPPAPLASHVTARDRTCRFPDCIRRAERCELDHVEPWEAQGTTCADNLIPLCARHHHLKHEGVGWHVKRLPEGQIEWTTPTGRTVMVPTASYPIDGTTSAIVRPTSDNEKAQAASETSS